MSQTLDDLAKIMEQIERIMPRKKVPAAVHVDALTYRALALLSVAVTKDEQVNAIKFHSTHALCGVPVYRHDEWEERKVEVRNLDGEVIEP